jgi:dihydrofolate reductase
MKISIIVAASENNVIGVNGELPWKLQKDMIWFKTKTKGSPVIMGRKTFESLGKPLPRRLNIVVSRSGYAAPEGVLVYKDIMEAVDREIKESAAEMFIIGGGEIYSLFINYADILYVTRVHTEVEGDAHFPVIPTEQFFLASNHEVEADGKNEFPFAFQIYIRR